MRCINCGGKISLSSKICHNCGKEIVISDNDRVIEITRLVRRCVGLITLCFIGYIFFYSLALNQVYESNFVKLFIIVLNEHWFGYVLITLYLILMMIVNTIKCFDIGKVMEKCK